MKKHEPTPAEVLAKLVDQLEREIGQWIRTREYGCQDPFWPDGCNMNLIRNHVISYKGEILNHCEKTGLDLPEAYYRATPPTVPENYMAPGLEKSDHQAARRKHLREMGETLTSKAEEYDEEQGALW